MPTLSNSMIPAPQGWDEFEQIVLSSLKIKWMSPELTRNGRQGQAQNGVDIYGKDSLGCMVGVQCKLTSKEIDCDTIKEEVRKAEGFLPKISALYIATNLPADAKIQREVRLLSQERLAQGGFPVGIFFWQDIIQDLIVNETEFRKHYPQFDIGAGMDRFSGTRLLCLIDVSYIGLQLRNYMALLFGEFSSSEEYLQIEKISLTIESCCVVLMDSVQSVQVNMLVNKFRQYVIPWVLGHEERSQGWKPANQYATSIESNIESLEYRLQGQELAIYTIGKILGRWSAVEIKPEYSFKNDDYLIKLIKQISGDCQILEEVKKILSDYHSYDGIGSFRFPHSIYNVIRNAIILQELVNRESNW